jgi:uncharacterized membrane protein YkvA (DUF1232 family)
MARQKKTTNKKTKAKTKKEDALRKIDKSFVEEGSKRVTDEDVEKVVNRADEIKNKFNEKGPLGKFVNQAKLLLSMIRDYWSSNYRHAPYWAIAAAVFTLLYVLNPLDLIPDVIPLIGYLDDAAVVSVCLLLIEQELDEYQKWKSAH